MSFTAVCPSCGSRLRLLDKLLRHKVTCPDCRDPFIAHKADDEAIEVAGDVREMPAEGWLIVCPSCGHTELVGAGPRRREHCPLCGSAFPVPVVASKRVKRKGPG